jgi:GAF domain-containing protein
MPDEFGVVSASEQEMREELERLRLLHSISLDFNSSLDIDELLPKVFDTVLSAVGAQGGSLWIAEGEELRCHLALGASSQKLVGTTVAAGTGFVGDVARKQRTTMVTEAMQDPRFEQKIDRSSSMIATTVMATAMVARGVTVGAIQVINKVGGIGIFDDRDREILEGLAAAAAIALRNAQLLSAERRARDLALLLEISREITSTLDLDRVLQIVVNLSAKAFSFDRGAVALMHPGQWEVRAVAGQDEVNGKDPEIQGLAERAQWAGVRGETFFLENPETPGSEAEEAFLSAFGGQLTEAGIRSGLYLPLKDEEGLLGTLVFESREPAFVSAPQREMAEILANQTAVALRNAQLYHQVPMADTIGALAAKKRAFMALPRRRKQVYLAIAILTILALTVLRWPYRVKAHEAAVRAFPLTEVRALVPGVIERVLVREGDQVAQGATVARLRNLELEAGRAALRAEAATADRSAALAASRNDAAEERSQRARLENLNNEIALLTEDIEALNVRAPNRGVVLTPRVEERTGLRMNAGDPVVTIGRTDTVTIEFTVDQHDLAVLKTGQPVRLRVDALPGRTFEGSLIFLGELPSDSADQVRFPARAAVPNPGGLLRTGMAAHARVLTQPMSILGRVVRGPSRWFRLAWWRLMP